MKLNKEQFKQIALLLFLAMVMALVVIYSKNIADAAITVVNIITPFIIGGAIAFVLNIPMTSIEQRLFSKLDGPKTKHLKRPASIITTLVLVVVILGLMGVIVIPNLSKTAHDFATTVPVFLTKLDDFLIHLNLTIFADENMTLNYITENWEKICEEIFVFIKSGAVSFFTSTIQLVTNVFGAIINSVIAFIFSIYILFQKETLGVQFKKLLKAYIPEKQNDYILKVCSLLYANFKHFITGQCLDAMLLGTICTVVLFICKIPYSLMIGVLIAFTALIPVVGAFIGCVIGVLLIVMVEPIKALWFIIIFIIVQQIDNNLIYPKVVGNSIGLPSIWVLVAITIGGSLCGVVGMLCFIPLVSTIYTLIREDVYHRIKD
ncbi:MAG: AI-2E family transporter [Firmicutes bacterium]|nr:AI-2E family transporter [Bacillota bacterium]